MVTVPYVLGIDLGTTYTAAAVVRDGQVRMIELGSRGAVVPSVLFLTEDATVLTGEAATRRAAADPARVAREFKRRIGDPSPILLGGSPWYPEALMARMLRWVFDEVVAREGEPPARVAVSHPANWGPYKKDLLSQATRLAELDVDLTITEPEAAAISYAAAERVPPGTVVAVYDLGGGTFDAAVLRKTTDGFEILGEPEGVDRLGGVDFDQAVFAFVSAVLDGAVESLDPADPAAMAALSRLRQECVDAKEALSSDTEASIPVLLPGLHTEIRITRSELEAIVRPLLSDTIAALRRALRSARVEPDQVDVLLLVGGSSRMPLVADLVGNELGKRAAVDAHPKHGVAQGAALAAAGTLAPANRHSAMPTTATPTRAVPTGATPTGGAPPAARVQAAGPAVVLPLPPQFSSGESVAPAPAVAVPAPPPITPLNPVAVPPSGPAASAPRRSNRLVLLVGLGVAAVAVGFFALRGGDAESGPGAGAESSGATACPPAGTPAVCIEQVELDARGALLARFSTHDVEIVGPVGGAFPADSLHALFFFDSTDPSEGRVWGPSSPFGASDSDLAGFTAGDAPGAAIRLCVLIQDSAGRVFSGTGNCAPLPDGT